MRIYDSRRNIFHKGLKAAHIFVACKWSSMYYVHSVLERIWIKGSYLCQWLPQGERGPPKESQSQWIEILHVGSQEQKKNSKIILD